MMTSLKRRFHRFLNQYSLESLITNLQSLLKDILENAQNSGLITIRSTAIPIIILAIFILFLVYATKLFFVNSFDFLKSLSVVSIIEINFYWQKMRNPSRVLAEELSALIGELFAVVLYLVSKLTDDNVIFEHEKKLNLERLCKSIPLKFLGWLFLAIISILMTIILVVTSVFGVPLLHRHLRNSWMHSTQ